MHLQSESRGLNLKKCLCAKAGVPAFTAPQPEEAMVSLQKRADELGVGILQHNQSSSPTKDVGHVISFVHLSSMLDSILF